MTHLADHPDGQVAERVAGPLHRHDAWADHEAWLLHGITGRTGDMSLFGSTPVGRVLPRWTALRETLGCTTIVHARQVHAGDVLVHDAVPPGIVVGPDADGHATRRPGVLLAVSVADCVPVFIAAPDVRAVALVHGGWRGIAAGIVETGIDVLRNRYGADPAAVHVHLGPAICGQCYEVGPEVPDRLGVPAAPRVDLRAIAAVRAARHGVSPARITTSQHCTRCGDSPFYSHRGGCAERQIAVLGVRPT